MPLSTYWQPVQLPFVDLTVPPRTYFRGGRHGEAILVFRWSRASCTVRVEQVDL